MMAPSMMRRLLALALATVVLDPLAPFAGAWAAAQPCRDHVCLCARHCPPQRSPAQSCHRSAPEDPSVRAACSHDEAARLASVAPAVLPAGTRPVVTPLVEFAVAAGDEDPTPGFRTIVPPPPRSA
jgi:hypothetical protein